MNELLELLRDGDGVGSWTAEGVVLHLLLAFVLGQLVAWVYVHTHHGLSYSRSTTQSLILLGLIVTLVMMAVGNSLARAFGLFGALALVRFRTPVKDTRDTAFLFIAVGIGIAVGSGHMVLAIVGTLSLCVIALYLSWTGFGARFAHDGLLRMRLPADGQRDAELRRLLRQYCRRFALVQVHDLGQDELEHSYQVQLLSPQLGQGLIAAVRGLAGVAGVSLLMQDRDSEP